MAPAATSRISSPTREVDRVNRGRLQDAEMRKLDNAFRHVPATSVPNIQVRREGENLQLTAFADGLQRPGRPPLAITADMKHITDAAHVSAPASLLLDRRDGVGSFEKSGTRARATSFHNEAALAHAINGALQQAMRNPEERARILAFMDGSDQSKSYKLPFAGDPSRALGYGYVGDSGNLRTFSDATVWLVRDGAGGLKIRSAYPSEPEV